MFAQGCDRNVQPTKPAASERSDEQAGPVTSEAGGRVIIITGPPGAGKTTVCRTLATEGGFERAVHLHTDDFFHAIRRGYVEPWRAGSERQNEIVTDVIVAAATTYARGGYVVFVDGIVGPWFLDRYQAAAARDGLDLDYVVLRPDEATTKERARARADHALRASGPVVTMHRAFADLGTYEAHVVDTSRQTAAETVASVARAIATGTHRVPAPPSPSSET
jgi:predicted kinase